jgi:hypothetical protein
MDRDRVEVMHRALAAPKVCPLTLVPAVKLRMEVDLEQNHDWLVLRGWGVLDRRAFASGRRAWSFDPTIRLELSRRNLDSGLAGGRLSRSGMVRMCSYFRTL